tara:strand:- start:503 stop:1831 length:1329 start_codon:yes stop_codon:yes gene_type:complete
MAEKGTVKEALEFKEAGVKYEKTLTNEQKKQVSLFQQINSLQKQVTERVKEQSSFVSGLTGEYRKQQELRKILKRLAEEELDATERANLSEKVKGINQELEAAAKAGDAFQNLFPNFGSGIASLESGFKSIGTVLTSGPLALVAIVAGIAMALMRIAKNVNATREQFGMSAKEALKLNFELKKAQLAAKAFGLSAEQVKESFDAVTQTFGIANGQAVQFSVQVARIARNTGLGVENTVELVSLFSAARNVSKDIALNMVEMVTQMASAEGVSRGILMKELASNADLFASFIGKGERNLIKAAAAAKKVGMEFGGLVELGDGLLDVTERINKEQTLSTILGKQISLERFAQLNAAGELEAAQQELSNQLQGINELSAQQTRFFAEQLGVATSDLVKLTGIRAGGMPMARGAGQSEDQKQTGLLTQIVENTKKSARTLVNEFGN